MRKIKAEDLKTGMVLSKDLGENTKHVVLVIPAPAHPNETWFGAFPQAETLTVHAYRLRPGTVPKTAPELLTLRRAGSGLAGPKRLRAVRGGPADQGGSRSMGALPWKRITTTPA